MQLFILTFSLSSFIVEEELSPVSALSCSAREVISVWEIARLRLASQGWLWLWRNTFIIAKEKSLFFYSAINELNETLQLSLQ